jgi:hypothetical protein
MDVNGTYRSVRGGVVGVCALGLVLVPSLPAASAATQPVIKQVVVNSRRVWTATGLTVHKGETIKIRATGFIHFGLTPIDHLTPTGMAKRSGCDALTGRRESTASPRPAPRLDCWSLIGKIGGGGPFAVGDSKTLEAANDGELSLGVNDNYLRDNAGTWSAAVTIGTGPAAAPVPTPKPAASKSSSSSKLLLMLSAVLVVVVLLAIVVLGRVRRARKAAVEAAPPARPEWRRPAAGPVPQPTPRAVRPVISIPEALAEAESHAVVVSPTEGDFTDTNIFEVEFPDTTSLRVGYNHFPEGALVRFRIAQRARAEVRGDFLTKGGGSQYHFVTVELNSELEPNPDGADVIFTWVIGGVPFQYSVRRVTAG